MRIGALLATLALVGAAAVVVVVSRSAAAPDVPLEPEPAPEQSPAAPVAEAPAPSPPVKSPTPPPPVRPPPAASVPSAPVPSPVIEPTDAQRPTAPPVRRVPLNSRGPQMVSEAYAIVEQGDVAGAMVRLDEALKTLPPGQMRQVASLLKSHLSGAFMKRQAFWHDRTVVDMVVLVDNEADLVRAIEQWDDQRFWPVLIDDGWLSTLFIEAFAPRQVVRWASPQREPANGPDVAALVTASTQRHHESMVRRRATDAPPGLVVMDPEGPNRCGGLALAMGRGQPVMVLRGVARLTDRVTDVQVRAINTPILEAMARLHLMDTEQWCGLTLAGVYPYQYEPQQYIDARQQGRSKQSMVLSVDDSLARLPDTTRVAVVGRLFGPPAQSVYQAMASLFLQPRSALMLDGYSHKYDQGWARYAYGAAAMALRSRYEVLLLAKDATPVAEFSQHSQPVLAHDMVWINSSGGPKRFAIMGEQRGTTLDIPIGRPAAFYVVHSFSASRPWDVDTLAGRAVAGGAYWYYGSSEEPTLTGFARPNGVVHKALAGTPLAFGARHLSIHPRSRPWKLVLLGDPLFTLRRTPAPRVEAIALPNATPVTRASLAVMISSGAGDMRAILRDLVVVRAMPGGEAVTLQMAAATAERLLDNPDPMTSADVIRAAWLMHLDRRSTGLAAAPYPVTRRHELAERLAALHRRSVFEGQMNAEQLDDARATLANLLNAGTHGDELVIDLRRWLAAMIRHERDTEALRWLRDQQKRYRKGRAGAALRTVLQQDEPTPVNPTP